MKILFTFICLLSIVAFCNVDFYQFFTGAHTGWGYMNQILNPSRRGTDMGDVFIAIAPVLGNIGAIAATWIFKKNSWGSIIWLLYAYSLHIKTYIEISDRHIPFDKVAMDGYWITLVTISISLIMSVGMLVSNNMQEKKFY